MKRASLFVVSLLLIPACFEAPDPRLAPQSHDEYTEPLSNAVIGTASRLTIVPPAAEPAAAPVPLVAPDGGADGEGGTPGRAFWLFDDCSPTSHFLADSSGGGTAGQQSLGAACVPGINNLGVRIRSAKDVIQVPDEPQFTVSRRVAVAAWVNPATVSGNQPIIIKRLNDRTSFSLGVHNGNIEMAVVLTSGKTFISRAPIAAGRWTHVAGMYDGTFVFLFIDGQQFGQVFAGGKLRNVFAPLRIGATSQSQFFHGVLDNVFISSEPITRDDLIKLSCIRRPSTLAVTPASGAAVAIGTAGHFEVKVTDNDIGSCSARSYNPSLGFEPNISPTVDFPPGDGSTKPGATLTFGVNLTPSEDATPGPHQFGFDVFSFSDDFERVSTQISFAVVVPQCFVFKRRELMITSTGVVDDRRTRAGGAWSLGHLLREMAPTADQAPAMAQALFAHWLTDQTINGFLVEARPNVQQVILDAWPRTPDGALDLDRAPFTLLAIVNRIDLRDLAAGSAGQVRFVFALDTGFFPQNFTAILEYQVPAQTEQDLVDWARRWHALSALALPSEGYDVALEAITRRVTERDAGAGRTNGSALLRLRTNDQALDLFGRWELREFDLSPATGLLVETTIKETPDQSFNQTTRLFDFVAQNEAAITAVIPGADSHTVPVQFQESPFLAGSIVNDFRTWFASGISAEARFHLALNTCNGCHGVETSTSFQMIAPRSRGEEARLSPFLTGATVFDPVSFQPRTLDDLTRRQTDLTALLCPP
jgi:hypothetical protein